MCSQKVQFGMLYYASPVSAEIRIIIIIIIMISRSSQNSKGVTLSEGVEWGWGGYEMAIFDQ